MYFRSSGWSSIWKYAALASCMVMNFAPERQSTQSCMFGKVLTRGRERLFAPRRMSRQGRWLPSGFLTKSIWLSHPPVS